MTSRRSQERLANAYYRYVRFLAGLGVVVLAVVVEPFVHVPANRNFHGGLDAGEAALKSVNYNRSFWVELLETLD